MRPTPSKFLFVHLPKCGGNSILSRLINTVDLHGHDAQNPRYEFLKDRDLNNYNFIFTFTRNPWDRLISAFYYLQKGGNCKANRRDYIKFFSKYKSAREAILNWKDDYFNQIHFKPQYSWICDNNKNLIPDFIGKTENFQEDFMWVS